MHSQASRFLTVQWRHLAMISYPVDSAILRSLVPRGTELDSWAGDTFVSLVGFQFLETTVLGLPIPFHRNFEEVNLRFYVRRQVPDGWRRGVVFLTEIVPRRAGALVARRVYNKRYVVLRMRHTLDLPAGGPKKTGSVAYEWFEQERWNRLRVRIAGDARLPEADSEESFITEHYWGYATQRDGSCLEYQVEHPRWRVWRAVECEVDCAPGSLYPPGFAEAVRGTPGSALVADGSAVIVRKGVRLPISP